MQNKCYEKYNNHMLTWWSSIRNRYFELFQIICCIPPLRSQSLVVVGVYIVMHINVCSRVFLFCFFLFLHEWNRKIKKKSSDMWINKKKRIISRFGILCLVFVSSYYYSSSSPSSYSWWSSSTSLQYFYSLKRKIKLQKNLIIVGKNTFHINVRTCVWELCIYT